MPRRLLVAPPVLLPPLLALFAWGRSAPVLGDLPGRVQAPLRRLSQIRVPFVENSGQFPSGIAFSAPMPFGAAFVTGDGRLVYTLRREADDSGRFSRRSRVFRQTLGETFVQGKAKAVGGRIASAGVSRFVGDDPSRWRSNLRSYEDVRLGEVWPGILVSLRARAGSLEKVFTVQPGAQVNRIRLRVDGARRLATDRTGALLVRTDGVRVSFSAPEAFQQRDGARKLVPVAYTLEGSTYGFRLGSHDPGLPVVIDPVLQSTYIGGGEADLVNAVVVHPSTGEVLVAGTTFSADLPRAAGGARGVSGGAADAFVARFDGSLTSLLQVTYLGGSGGEEGLSLAVHPSTGDVYVAGYTSSTDFPGTAGGAQSTAKGGDDGFVARLDRTLTRLFRATYCGGGDVDKIVAVGVNPSNGDIDVAGQTQSSDLPRTSGGFQPSHSGDVDGFLARFDPTLSTILQASYVGGTGAEYLRAMAIHPLTGEIYVGGQTLSSDFPGTPGGATGGTNGNWDGFLARLDPTLTTLIQASYLGGAGADDILGIAVHPVRGEVFVTGWTQFVDFPGTAGGAQPAAGGSAAGVDGFVARFNPELTALLQSTFLGGSDGDYGYGIAIHPSQGDVYVTGETFSSDLPGAAGGAAAVPRGRGDAFVARFDSTLTAMLQTTYLGGEDEDIARAVTFEPSSGDVIVAGATSSAVFPAAAIGAQGGYAGGSDFGGDGFVTRLGASLRQEGGGCVAPNPLCFNPGRPPVVPSNRRGRNSCELPCR